MRTGNPKYLVLSLILPLLSPLSSAAPMSTSIELLRPTLLSLETNTTKPATLPIGFPNAVPPDVDNYHIQGSDLTVQLSSLGLISGRNETLVKEILNEAFRASVKPFRPQTPMSMQGNQYQKDGFVLTVLPSKRLPGQKPLSWGYWSEVLLAMSEYVDAYPGYDFSYNIWWKPEDQASQGYVIGTGFAKTR